MSKRDMFGQDIVVGTVIVYPNRRGSETELRFGKVLEIHPDHAVLLSGGTCPECKACPKDITAHRNEDGTVTEQGKAFRVARVRFTHFERAAVVQA